MILGLLASHCGIVECVVNARVTTSIALSIAACWCVSASGPAVHGENGVEPSSGTLHETHIVSSTKPLVGASSYKMWVPEDTPVVRSVFAINMRAAGKHLFFQDPEWRALAKRTHSAMMLCEFVANGVRDNGYGLSMLKACEQFAKELARPELRHAPLVLWGHSMGGRVAQDFARFRPSRVLAFHIALRKIPSSAEFMNEECESMRIPVLYLMGEEDTKPEDIRMHFERARRNRSPRAWIWLPKQGHWPRGMSHEKDETTTEEWRAWAANDFVIPWTESIIRLRLPENAKSASGSVKLRPIDPSKGWLGDIKTGQVSSYTSFTGSKSAASWFPNEEVAQAWSEYSFP